MSKSHTEMPIPIGLDSLTDELVRGIHQLSVALEHAVDTLERMAHYSDSHLDGCPIAGRMVDEAEVALSEIRRHLIYEWAEQVGGKA